MSDALLIKVHEWLEKNGYPLEYETQHAFDSAGMGSVQGFHVKDFKTDAVREIDLIANAQRRLANDHLVQCTHVVECKQNGRPWIAFTRPIGASAKFCIEQTIGNARGEATVMSLADDEDLRALDLFSQREATAFGGSEAKLDDRNSQDANAKDGCYSKLQTVVTNSASLARSFYDEEEHTTLIFPVIVLGGQLFAASYDMKARKMVVAAADEVRFQWRGAEALSANHATIDVVTAQHLPKWLATRRKDVAVLMQKLVSTIGQRDANRPPRRQNG